MNKAQLAARGRELVERLDYIEKRLSPSQRSAALMSLEADFENNTADLDRYEQSRGFVAKMHGGGNDISAVDSTISPAAGTGGPIMPNLAGMAVKNRVRTPRVGEVPETAIKEMISAAKRHQNFRIEVPYKSVADDSSDVVTKNPNMEGGFGLPNLLHPELTRVIPYDPTNVWELFNSTAVTGASIEYYSHTANTNAAGPVVEGGIFPDLGMTWAPQTATPVKISAMVSASWELLEDAGWLVSWINLELGRAVTDAINGQILAGSGTAPSLLGIQNLTTTLTHDHSADADTVTTIDAVLLAANALRTGAAYCDPNLLVLHPSDWEGMRQLKDTLGRPILNPVPAREEVWSLYGFRVAISTKMTQGTGILMNTDQAVLGFIREGLIIESSMYGESMVSGTATDNWSHDFVSFRAKTRLSYGVLRPAAICLIKNL